MSTMEERYKSSDRARVKEARNIPGPSVNFFDQNNEFQEEFVINEKPGDPTKFTDKAQKYFDNEVKTVSLPTNFQPTEQGVTLHRYTPEKGYYDPGAAK
jgi:hypothetical protein